MAEHSAENTIDHNGLPLDVVNHYDHFILYFLDLRYYWFLYEGLAIQETVCKNSSSVLLHGQYDESFQTSQLRGSTVCADFDA
jgi:hypothetical protein